MTKRMVTSAVFAGFAAGLIAVLLHFAFVQKLILASEQYEQGELTHFLGGAAAHNDDGAQGATAVAPPKDANHSHDHGEAAQGDAAKGDPALGNQVEGNQVEGGQVEVDQGHGAHSHSHSHGASNVSDLQRNGLTALFMILIYTGYALILTAGYAVAEMLGKKIGPTQGLLWGLAGFAAFQLAPAMGLAPELPGTVAADITARQIWWWFTVLATGGGIVLLAYGTKAWAFVAAGALLAAPHVIGAPDVQGYFGTSPPELAAAFAARVLGTALVVWAALGWVAGYFWANSVRER